jgi:hypothetical protein
VGKGIKEKKKKPKKQKKEHRARNINRKSPIMWIHRNPNISSNMNYNGLIALIESQR